MTPEERSAIDNAIWLCGTCSILIDKDEARYPAELLRHWRAKAEAEAFSELGKQPQANPVAAPLVVSYYQSGGQTAHTIINSGTVGRRLTGRVVPEPLLLRMRSRKVAPVVIVLMSPDGETQRFAIDMSTALARIRINDGPTEPAVMWGPLLFDGVRIHSTATDAGDPLAALAEWLHKEGFRVRYSAGENGNYVYITPLS